MDRAADVWQPTIASWAAALEGPLVDYANKMQVWGGGWKGVGYKKCRRVAMEVLRLRL